MWSKRIRLCISGFALLALLGCAPSNVAFRQGYKAELRKDWDSALVNYEKAVQSSPDNAQYIVHEKNARLQASLMHLKQGRRLLSEGREDDASGEFQKAVSIDPTNEAAAQELKRLLAKQQAAKEAREKALKGALKAEEEAVGGEEVKLKPFPATPLPHLHLIGESRKVFETLAKLAELNVAFTSDFQQVQSRPVTLDLSMVKVEDALKVLCLETKTFWRPVTSNTILIIPDSPANRRDYEEEVLKTVYLSNPAAAADRSAITTALKGVLGLQRVVENADSNAIIIRDTPEKVAAAEKLIHDLDRGKAEVLIDVAVVEADRDRLRNLGISPASLSSSGTVTNGITAGLVFAPPTSTTESATGATVTTAAGALNTLSYTDYAASLPGAIANAVLNDSRSHILQNPQLRATDGQTAKLRIGTRIPYATGSFLPSFGGVASSSTTGVGFLASTQFQYQDIGVNLDLTPHVTANGEVAIHAMIEISSLGANISIGGFSQPTFGQRRIEHDIRLKEGEVSVLGGLIQSTVSNEVTGVPFLGDVPLLRYFFSSETHERQELEVVVMLTPRVIRLPEPAEGGATSVALSGETGAVVPESGAPAAGPQQFPGRPQ